MLQEELPVQRSIPRIAAVHDLSGFGRTSLTVVIPIFSALGIQVCPLPTAVLSTHTSGFDDFRFVDLSDAMNDFLDHWISMNLRFDAVYSGFLGSPRQVDTVIRCIEGCLAPGGLVMVDPVLGDNGKLDPTMTPEMVEAMRFLVTRAGCITPNLTEAALLLSEPYPHEAEAEGLDPARLKDWLRRLTDMGPEAAVITSVPAGNGKHRTFTAAHQKSRDTFWKVECQYLPAFYPGTGDTFTSVLTGAMLQGDSLPLAMDRAVQFVTLAIRAAFGHDTPHREGVFLERVLHALTAPLTVASYTLLDGDQ